MSDPNEVSVLIDSAGGRWFTLDFIKKNGELRTMNARVGVKKHLKGGKMSFNPDDYCYRVVWDAQKKEYRMVNLKTVSRFKCGKVEKVFN